MHRRASMTQRHGIGGPTIFKASVLHSADGPIWRKPPTIRSTTVCVFSMYCTTVHIKPPEKKARAPSRPNKNHQALTSCGCRTADAHHHTTARRIDSCGRMHVVVCIRSFIMSMCAAAYFRSISYCSIAPTQSSDRTHN